jgi:hypothetical protein
MKDVARHERRVEEREALDVVPVNVAEEHVRSDGHLGQQLLAEQAKPGAAVEDEDGLAGAHFDTAGVAPDLHRARPGRGDAPADSPEGDVHPLPVALATVQRLYRNERTSLP